MVWFKIDDGFWSHPKILELSDAAIALWVRAGAYCAQHKTSGAIPTIALDLMGQQPGTARELVEEACGIEP